MKQKTKLMLNSLWYRERIDNPIQVIKDVFENNDIADLKRFLRRLFTGPCQKAACTTYSYMDIIYYLERIESLLNAAYLIDQKKVTLSCILYDADLHNPKHYCGRKKYLNLWDYIPKHLSLREYIDPCLAIQKTFTYCPINEWKQRLKLLSNSAFSVGTLFENDIEMDLIGNYSRLSALIEATHLIEVRHVVKTA